MLYQLLTFMKTYRILKVHLYLRCYLITRGYRYRYLCATWTRTQAFLNYGRYIVCIWPLYWRLRIWECYLAQGVKFRHVSYFLFACFSQRILQNSFTDGVANPCDAASIKSYIVKNEGASSGYPGSTYLLSQKFEFNWMVIGNMDKVNVSFYLFIHHP